jgi:integrase
VRAALETGCRYSELTSLKTKDYNADAGTVTIPHPKGGTPRHIPLTDNGRALLDAATAGLKGDDLVFTHADGRVWAASHQQRPIADACKSAKIAPPIGFHDLRHTYASLLAMKNTPMAVIAQALGHADHRMTVKHYAHLGPSYFRRTVRAKLPNFGKIRSKVRRLRP